MLAPASRRGLVRPWREIAHADIACRLRSCRVAARMVGRSRAESHLITPAAPEKRWAFVPPKAVAMSPESGMGILPMFPRARVLTYLLRSTGWKPVPPCPSRPTSSHPTPLSPPCTPRYNGSAEAGGGSLKTRIFYQAARHGSSDGWTSDDVGAPRQRTNCTCRPWGPHGPTPQERRHARTPITSAQRQVFRRCLGDMERQVRVEQGLEDEPLHWAARAAVAWAAVRRALETLGYLQARRRRITPPFNSPLRANVR